MVLFQGPILRDSKTTHGTPNMFDILTCVRVRVRVRVVRVRIRIRGYNSHTLTKS